MRKGFLDWFVGFAEGEGSFLIYRDSPRGTVRCSFSIVQRRDNRAVLEAIPTETGLGKVYDHRGYGEGEREGHFKQHPTSRWQIHTIGDCLKMVNLLENVHFYSKKKRLDFELWAAAIRELSKPMNRRNFPLIDSLLTAQRNLHGYSTEVIEQVEQILRGGG